MLFTEHRRRLNRSYCWVGAKERTAVAIQDEELLLTGGTQVDVIAIDDRLTELNMLGCFNERAGQVTGPD
jgi:hypothetical protein